MRFFTLIQFILFSTFARSAEDIVLPLDCSKYNLESETKLACAPYLIDVEDIQKINLKMLDDSTTANFTNPLKWKLINEILTNYRKEFLSGLSPNAENCKIQNEAYFENKLNSEIDLARGSESSNFSACLKRMGHNDLANSFLPTLKKDAAKAVCGKFESKLSQSCEVKEEDFKNLKQQHIKAKHKASQELMKVDLTIFKLIQNLKPSDRDAVWRAVRCQDHGATKVIDGCLIPNVENPETPFVKGSLRWSTYKAYRELMALKGKILTEYPELSVPMQNGQIQAYGGDVSRYAYAFSSEDPFGLKKIKERSSLYQQFPKEESKATKLLEAASENARIASLAPLMEKICGEDDPNQNLDDILSLLLRENSPFVGKFLIGKNESVSRYYCHARQKALTDYKSDLSNKEYALMGGAVVASLGAAFTGGTSLAYFLAGGAVGMGIGQNYLAYQKILVRQHALNGLKNSCLMGYQNYLDQLQRTQSEINTLNWFDAIEVTSLATDILSIYAKSKPFGNNFTKLYVEPVGNVGVKFDELGKRLKNLNQEEKIILQGILQKSGIRIRIEEFAQNIQDQIIEVVMDLAKLKNLKGSARQSALRIEREMNEQLAEATKICEKKK